MNQQSEWLFEAPFPSREAFEGHSYSNQEDESEWLFEASYSNPEYGRNFEQESPLLESKQGEHIFNALGDLANEFVDMLTKRINKNGSASNTAVESIRELQKHAAQLIQQRNHQDFRTGSQGNITNDQRYSEFAKNIRTAIDNLLSKDPSRHTQGYTNLNRLLDNMDYYTIDQIAKQSARGPLSDARKREFDKWYEQTRSLMHGTFKTLIDAALAVNKTHLPPSRTPSRSPSSRTAASRQSSPSPSFRTAPSRQPSPPSRSSSQRRRR